MLLGNREKLLLYKNYKKKKIFLGARLDMIMESCCTKSYSFLDSNSSEKII